MKKVLIINGESTNTENYAIRDVLENFGYIVTMFNVGRPQDYFDILSQKIKFDYDYLIIGCHGEEGKIIVPILDDDIYYKDECRTNIGYNELKGSVSVKNKTIICTGCTTGSGNLYKVFTKNGNVFIAPYDYIDGKSDLLFIVNLFYYLSCNNSLQKSFDLANKIDLETNIYRLYK